MKRKSRIIGLISIVPGTVWVLYLTAALGMVVLDSGKSDFGPNPYQTAFLLIVPFLALVQLWRLLYREAPLSKVGLFEKAISTVLGIPAVLLGAGIMMVMLFTAPTAIVIYGVLVLPLTIFGAWCLYELWLA